MTIPAQAVLSRQWKVVEVGKNLPVLQFEDGQQIQVAEVRMRHSNLVPDLVPLRCSSA
jgi:hypothetical protein